MKLDQLYPVDGYFRYVQNDVDGYEFLYPSTWVADKTVSLANVRERELPMGKRERKTTPSTGRSVYVCVSFCSFIYSHNE